MYSPTVNEIRTISLKIKSRRGELILLQEPGFLQNCCQQIRKSLKFVVFFKQ